MRQVAIAVLLLLAGACAADPRPDSASSAAAFARQLAKSAPEDQGVPLRSYFLVDLDSDGVLEVLEHVSAFERTPGFLNVELEPAFEWINVYRRVNGRYMDRTSDFQNFLRAREAHYALWLRLLDTPQVLSEDSRGLVATNKAEFTDILQRNLARLRSMSR